VLAISSSTPGVAAVSVSLNGGGQLTAGLTATPGLVTFANPVGMGRTSTAQTVTIANTTSFSIAALSLAASGPFVLSANTCTGALAAGASCSAAIVFAPVATGAAAGSLTVTSPALTVPTAVALAGTGFNFSVASSGAASLTVSGGQTAKFPLAVSLTGAQATFSFACGSLPANASCTFNPGSETLNAGVEGNVTVQVATSASAMASRSESLRAWHALPLVCGVLLLPLALKRGRKAFFVVLLAVLLTAGMTSCTSSSGGTGGTPPGGGNGSNTAAGTYTIPVTVTASGLSQVVELTLTVD
jgi:hypothetical protein